MELENLRVYFKAWDPCASSGKLPTKRFSIPQTQLDLSALGTCGKKPEKLEMPESVRRELATTRIYCDAKNVTLTRSAQGVASTRSAANVLGDLRMPCRDQVNASSARRGRLFCWTRIVWITVNARLVLKISSMNSSLAHALIAGLGFLAPVGTRRFVRFCLDGTASGSDG